MASQSFRVLFLSQRNAARSMMAEAIANSIGHGEIEAYSAGVHPSRNIDPLAVELLEHAGLPAPDHPPRHVRDFSAFDSPQLDFIFTLSDEASGETPPSWPGHPITAHWRCADPEDLKPRPRSGCRCCERAPSSNAGCGCSSICRWTRSIA